MRRTLSQELEARRCDLQDQVVVYALTGRRPPQTLIAAFHRARHDVEAARRGEFRVPAQTSLLSRWFGQTAVG